jgi:hypothetical protein
MYQVRELWLLKAGRHWTKACHRLWVTHPLLAAKTQSYPLQEVAERGTGVTGDTHTNSQLGDHRPASSADNTMNSVVNHRQRAPNQHTSRIGFTSEVGPGLWNVGHSTEGGKGLNTLMSSVLPLTLMVPKSRNSRPCDALCLICGERIDMPPHGL